MNPTEQILEQGKALVWALEALKTIEPTGLFELAITWLQLQAYRRRLRAIVQLAPTGLAEETLSDRSPL